MAAWSGRPSAEVMQAIRESCLTVADRPVELAEVFYGHLFEMAPGLRTMFAVDMTHQMQKMTETLLTAIDTLAHKDTADLEVLLYRMGADHYVRHQVEPEHYVHVAHALTRAIRDLVGLSYSSYLSSSWIALCQWVTNHMCAGARSAMEDRPVETLASAMPRPRTGEEYSRGFGRGRFRRP
ncbi:MAG: globin domain-containing protein [Pseudonocardia sp.]|nr:globin domain-containing protein [Pseudonocardia sp.]